MQQVYQTCCLCIEQVDDVEYEQSMFLLPLREGARPPQVLREGKRPACGAPAAGSHCWLRLPSEQSLVSKAEVGGRAIAQDEVIQDSNVQELPGLDEALGHGAILAARRRVA